MQGQRSYSKIHIQLHPCGAILECPEDLFDVNAELTLVISLEAVCSRLHQGNNIEDVGQTAGNLEKATIVKGRDTRVFQDGIYIISKGAAQ